MNYTIKKGDCMQLLKEIPSGSVDLILCDPPYGTIKGLKLNKNGGEYRTEWDNILPLMPLFSEYERVLRKAGTIVLFSQEPFTSNLRTLKPCNIEFCYPLYWKKDKFANFLNVNNAPVSYIEDLSVFAKRYDGRSEDAWQSHPLRPYAREVVEYIGKPRKAIIKELGGRVDHFLRFNSMQWELCTAQTYSDLCNMYNLQEMPGFKSYEELSKINDVFKSENGRTFNNKYKEDLKHISNFLEFAKDKKSQHPTQKPVKLLQHLISIYSNEGDTVLDNTMGSGSTGVACAETGRNFIGFEMDDQYFEIAKSRIYEAYQIADHGIVLN